MSVHDVGMELNCRDFKVTGCTLCGVTKNGYTVTLLFLILCWLLVCCSIVSGLWDHLV